MHRRDTRKRVHKIAGGIKQWYVINRLKCKECNRLHNELPDCLVPYKHYDAELIEDVVEGIITEEDKEIEDYPCEGTLRHWKWWVFHNEENINGQLRSVIHNLLDLSTEFLKSSGSLLRELRERISPGWLRSVIWFLYNSGGRIEPRPED